MNTTNTGDLGLGRTEKPRLVNDVLHHKYGEECYTSNKQHYQEVLYHFMLQSGRRDNLHRIPQV